MTNRQQAAALSLWLSDSGDKEWWIVNHTPPIGPYDTKAEAQETLKRVQWFYKNFCLSEADELDYFLN